MHPVLRHVVEPGPVRRTIVVATLTATAAAILLWQPEGDLSLAGQRTLAIFVVAVGLWVSKALPLMVTSMLAIILFPLLDVCSAKEAFSHFGHPAVFFILGTFILSAGLAETGLARRMALRLLHATGDSPQALATGLFTFGLVASCFVSEHAVAALQLPIVLELARVLDLRRTDPRFARALFFAMAWGCIIGGVTTFLGGARAPLALGILDEGWGETLSFGEYTSRALPVMLPVAAVGLGLVRLCARNAAVDLRAGRQLLASEMAKMGRVSGREIGMGALLAATVVAWVVTGPQWLAVIALAATSVGFGCELISWPRVHEHVDWGLILMYGGAIVVGRMVVETGLGPWAGTVLLEALHANQLAWLFAPLLTVATLVLTEAASNTAIVAATLPVAIPLGIELEIPATVVALLVTLASGFAFCLPMGTPATAMALSNGYVRPWDLIWWGLPLKLAALLALLVAPAFVWP
jgi:sodium-dependent dicarboxylate transporter 2/3/5